MKSKTAMQKAIDSIYAHTVETRNKMIGPEAKIHGTLAAAYYNQITGLEYAISILESLLEQEQSDLIDLRQRCAENARIESGNCFKPECDVSKSVNPQHK